MKLESNICSRLTENTRFEKLQTSALACKSALAGTKLLLSMALSYILFKISQCIMICKQESLLCVQVKEHFLLS